MMLIRLDALSLNGDEGFTAEMVKLPWTAMLSDLTRIDYNMSFHYVFLKTWSGLFGTSEAALRLPSAIAALAALVLAYRLVQRLFGSSLAALSVLLLALNPYFIRFGVTARPYGFLILWSVVATIALVQATATGQRRWWLLYAVTAVVGLHIHLTAVVVVGAHGLFTLFYQRRLTRLNLEALAIIAGAGFLPTLLFLAPTDTLNWIGPFDLRHVVSVGYDLGGGFPLGWLVLALATAGIFAVARTDRIRWLPAFWLAVPVLAYLALAPFQSLFVSEYFAGLVAPFSILTALGLNRLLRRFREFAIPIVLSVGTAGLIVSAVAGDLREVQGWRELVPMMVDRVLPGDAVAFPNAFYRIVAMYYSADALAGPFPPASPILPGEPWGSLTPYQLDSIKRTGVLAHHDVFEPEALSWPRVWVVGQGDEFDGSVIADLLSHGYVETDAATSGPVSARLFVAG
jgi:mannosyltransferase